MNIREGAVYEIPMLGDKERRKVEKVRGPE